MIHDFDERLKWSKNASLEAFWNEVYKKAFPDMLKYELYSGKRRGVHRLIYLPNDKILYINEKKRETEYNDIVLEYISVDTTGAPGWIERDLEIDYIAYAFMSSRRVYLLDWPVLRQAWQLHKDEWKTRYGIPPARNKGYKTLSAAVPISVLHDAVAMSISPQLRLPMIPSSSG